MAGGGVALIGITLVPLLSNLFGWCRRENTPRPHLRGRGKGGNAAWISSSSRLPNGWKKYSSAASWI